MSSVVKDTKEAAANQPNQNNNSKKAPSKQELTNCRIEYEKKRTFAILLDDTLRKVRQKPSLYNNPHLKPLRQFCEHRDNNKELYLGIVEETTPLLPNNGGKPVVDLTPNYIQTMAIMLIPPTSAIPLFKLFLQRPSFVIYLSKRYLVSLSKMLRLPTFVSWMGITM